MTSSVPEHLFKLFDLVVGKFLGAAVIKEGSGVSEGPGIDLRQHRGVFQTPPCDLRPSRTGLYLNADAALQFELQADHVHLRGRAQEPELGHLGAHLIYGHLDGAQVALVLVHDGYSLLHVRETVGGCQTGQMIYATYITQKQL